MSRLKKIFLSLFIYFERDRGSASGEEGPRERERERERERILNKLHTLSAQSLMWGLNPWTMRSWPEPKPRVGHLTHRATQAPQETENFKPALAGSSCAFPIILWVTSCLLCMLKLFGVKCQIIYSLLSKDLAKNKMYQSIYLERDKLYSYIKERNQIHL